MLAVSNMTPVPRTGYRIGVPAPGRWVEVLNTDAAVYGGGDVRGEAVLTAEDIPAHGREWSLPLTLPPLATVWLRRE